MQSLNVEKLHYNCLHRKSRSKMAFIKSTGQNLLTCHASEFFNAHKISFLSKLHRANKKREISRVKIPIIIT